MFSSVTLIIIIIIIIIIMGSVHICCVCEWMNVRHIGHNFYVNVLIEEQEWQMSLFCGISGLGCMNPASIRGPVWAFIMFVDIRRCWT